MNRNFRTDDQYANALAAAHGNQTEAARRLGVTRSAVWRYVQRTKAKLPDTEFTPDETPAPTPEPEPIESRHLRDADRKIERLTEQLKLEKQRRLDAERELHDNSELDKILQELDLNAIRSRSLAKQVTAEPSGGCTAIVCATDWHLEKNVDPATVSGLNEYNLDIARRRIDNFWKRTIRIIDFYRGLAPVNEIILWLGGDLINGHLHDEDVEGNFLGPTEAIAEVCDHVATGIDHLKQHGGAPLRVVTNNGNHARTTARQRYATGWRHSWEWLAYTQLAKVYQSVPFEIARGYLLYTAVQGRVVRFHHGDGVKYLGGVGGLSIPMQKSVLAWNRSRNAELSINGHYHQFLDHHEWVSCGALIGVDPYALTVVKASYQPPTQTVVFMDKSRGKTLSVPVLIEKPLEDLC
jgi:predicted transcriptional regulator